MSFAAIFLILVLASVITFGWIAICMIAMIIRLVVAALKSPFRAARRFDDAIYRRRAATPARRQRWDDLHCHNRSCGARLPAEAKFCARCGGTLSRWQARTTPAAPTVGLPTSGYTQVA